MQNKASLLVLVIAITSGSLGIFYFWKRYFNNAISRIALKHNQKRLRDVTTIESGWNPKITSLYKDKCVGCILGVTCGDILGSGKCSK